jgi:hypothetical protein
MSSATTFRNFQRQFNDRLAILLGGVKEYCEHGDANRHSQRHYAAHAAWVYGAYGFTPTAAAEEYIRQCTKHEKQTS